jgi:hypothetical protein
MVLLMMVCLSACGPNDLSRIEASAQSIGQARAAAVWPDLPPDCRRTARHGIQPGDRLDVAVLKADAALSRQNARTLRCADWYDGQQRKPAL